jgi:hypothetical protein
MPTVPLMGIQPMTPTMMGYGRPMMPGQGMAPMANWGRMGPPAYYPPMPMPPPPPPDTRHHLVQKWDREQGNEAVGGGTAMPGPIQPSRTGVYSPRTLK